MLRKTGDIELPDPLVVDPGNVNRGRLFFTADQLCQRQHRVYCRDFISRAQTIKVLGQKVVQRNGNAVFIFNVFPDQAFALPDAFIVKQTLVVDHLLDLLGIFQGGNFLLQ